MKKVRRFNGEDESEVSDETLNQLRQNQTERMARLARGESANAPAAPTSRSMAVAAPAEAEPAAPEKTAEAKPAAAAPKAKPAIVTKEQLQAFKAKYGADKDLTDYMNAQAGGLKRRNAPSPGAPSAPPPAAAPKVEAKKADTPVERGLPAMSAKERSAAIAQIPTGGDGTGPTASAGNSASGSELGRNISNTLSALPISRGIQAAQSGAKLAGRKAVEEFVKKDPNWRNKELEILKDISKPLALPKPTPRLGYDKAGAKAAERSGRAAEQRSEMLKENLKRYGMTERTSPDAINAVRKNLGMGRGFKVMNKGGSVKGYASGGSVSSASKRADGCAIRGKTRA